MKTVKLATLLLGAALMTGVGATPAFAKCSGEKAEAPASKCSADKKAKTTGKCTGEKKALNSGKYGNSTMPPAPMQGK